MKFVFSGVAALVWLVLMALFHYMFSFSLSLASPVMFGAVVCLVVWVILSFIDDEAWIYGVLPGAIIGFILIGVIALANSAEFNTTRYSALFEYTEANFEVYTATLENIPLLDKKSADMIARRRFGELTDYVSQYKVVDSEQIIHEGRPVRLSVLEHAGFWRWRTNRYSPGYILVDMQTHRAELVRTEQPIIYSERSFFSKNIRRHIRSNYRSKLFMQPTAELNEAGELYWVAPTYKRVVGLFGGRLIDGLILVNAHTGEHKHYTDLSAIPEWVDNVYPTDYIMKQYDYKGKLSNGFWNTVSSKTGMTMTTKGYNYIPMGTDNSIYTGITSVSMADESNIAFILTNKRTKETKYYRVSGAEEYTAMAVAEGSIQHLGYTATFPVLLNIEGVPTYVLSLKDKSDIVRMYAMVQVDDFRNVVVHDNLTRLNDMYLSKLAGEELGEEVSVSPPASIEYAGDLVEGILSEPVHVVHMGDVSYIVFKLEGSDAIYTTPAMLSLELLFTGVGETVSVEASEYKQAE